MEADRKRELAQSILRRLPKGLRKAALRLLRKTIIDTVRLQMLYNIGNGWSWYAYKKLGPKGIVELELEMWESLMPQAVEELLSLVEPTGASIQQARQVLDFVCRINGYRLKYLEQTPKSLTWEYTYCPNWDSMLQMKLDDYLSVNGQPALVSCQPGCTKIHEIYFRKIDPAIRVKLLKKRPQADNTCILNLEIDSNCRSD
jgi:hypothetical protein